MLLIFKREVINLNAKKFLERLFRVFSCAGYHLRVY
jgi:hypothetical protein